jgi:hypothetical protein
LHDLIFWNWREVAGKTSWIDARRIIAAQLVSFLPQKLDLKGCTRLNGPASSISRAVPDLACLSF